MYVCIYLYVFVYTPISVCMFYVCIYVLISVFMYAWVGKCTPRDEKTRPRMCVKTPANAALIPEPCLPSVCETHVAGDGDGVQQRGGGQPAGRRSRAGVARCQDRPPGHRSTGAVARHAGRPRRESPGRDR